MTKTLIAYHNDPTIKQKYLDRVKAHREADQLVQGYGYWNDGKGCAVGCTLHGNEHKNYEKELGVPETIARLEDCIFEGLPRDLALLWPERFLASIRPGTDLSFIWPRFSLWLLGDEQHGVLQYCKGNQKCADVVGQVMGLYQQWVDTGIKPSADEFRKAAEAAWAARAAAEAAARAAAWAAEAAWAAWAGKNFWIATSNQLVLLLETAPIAK